MIKVLVNAYACSPNMGSEPGMAWNWCVNLANHCELHIITEGEFKDKIEEVLPTLPQGKNMHFYYNPVSDAIRKMCWNQGDWRFYKHYKKWQFETYQMATKIVFTQKIAILHQLNMIGFREPGYLWKIQNIPLVWGPVDAKLFFPVSYLQGAPIKTKIITFLKNYITFAQLKFSKRIHLAVNNASIIVAASSNSQQTFQRFFKLNAPLINETGCYIQEHELIDKTTKQALDLLWVGKFDSRKQLSLAINTLAQLKNPKIILHIVGGGNQLFYENLAKKMGVENQCKWYGVISHKEVQEKMKNCDLLFFTSVAEGTPHVVLEAIGNNLPVLCFDTCGQGDSIDEKVGVKIKLSNFKQSTVEFAKEINSLFNDRKKLEKLATNCKEKQIELSWNSKISQMLALYKSLI